jgi:hypothetical protein
MGKDLAVDGRAVALAAHLAEFVFHAAPDAAQVDTGYAVELLQRALGGRSVFGHDAGVVEGRVQSAELATVRSTMAST